MSGPIIPEGESEGLALPQAPSHLRVAPPRTDWRLPLGIALLLHLAVLAAGLLSRHDALLDLINAGEVEAVAPTDPATDTTSEVTLVDLTPPPPPEPNPEFVVPQEDATPAAPIPPPAPDETPTPVNPAPPQPDTPTPVAETPPPVAAPVLPVPDPAPTASTPTPAAEEAAPSGIVIGEHDFPKPPYPYDAKRKHYQGTVIVSLNIVDGEIVDAEIASSSGYGILDAAAKNWICKKWHFPAEVTRSLTQPICFELADKA